MFSCGLKPAPSEVSERLLPIDRFRRYLAVRGGSDEGPQITPVTALQFEMTSVLVHPAAPMS